MRKRYAYFFTGALIFLLSVLLLSCSGGGKGGGGGPVESDFQGNISELPAAAPATYQEGTPVILTEATIGTEGGTLTGPAGTPVEGVVVTVPAGALSEPTTLSLGYDNGTFTNVKSEEQNVVIVLQSSGATNFQKQLKIEFPFTDANRVPVPYYINPEGRLELVRALPVDRAAGRSGFLTWHVSDYTWMNKDPASPGPVWNGFLPAKDGFVFSNTIVDDYTPNGRCEGISTFTKWYYNTYGSGLASKFTAPIPTKTSKQKALTGQEVIATRSQISVAWYMTHPTWFTDDLATGNAYSIMLVQDALSKGASAVMVGLVGSGGHAVLAIGFTDNQIAVYDSNHPMKVKAIDYKFTSPGKATISYGNVNQLDVWGNGELPLRESLTNILHDAEASFHGENQTKIKVTSHQDGQEVDEKDILLEGLVYSGEVLISEIEAQIFYEDGSQSEPIIRSVPEDTGTFKLPLTLKNGNNTVYFKTRGRVANTVNLLNIPNDPMSILLKFKEEQPAAGTGSLTVSSTITVDGPSGHSVETISYSVDASYFVKYLFDYGACDLTQLQLGWPPADCWRLFADAIGTASLPITINYHFQGASYDQGVWIGSQTWDAGGTLNCSGRRLFFVPEPGGSSDNYTLRLTTGGIDICPGNARLTAVGEECDMDHNCDTVTSESWIDANQVTIPSLDEVDSPTVPPCKNPARIQSSDIEPWIADQTGAKTWTFTTSSNCQDGDDTVTDNTTVTLTLVP